MRNFNLPISIGIALLAIGNALFILHYPFSIEIRSIGAGAIFFFYSFRFYHKKPKQTPDYLKVLLITGWTLSAILKINSIANHPILTWLIFGIIFIWAGMEIEDYFNKKTNKQAIVNHKIFLVSAGFLSIGSLARIMHWPYNNELMLIGTLLGGTWAILEIYRKSN